MPHHYNCCIPGCHNSFRNAPTLHYYRIPRDPVLQKTYIQLLRNETLKLDSESTRICSAHFEGGLKLSRTHLPSLFPWTKEKTPRRALKRLSYEGTIHSINQKKQMLSSSTKNPEENPCCYGETNIEQSTILTDLTVECQTILTGSTIDTLQKEIKEVRERSKKDLGDVNNELARIREENKKLKNENECLKKEVTSLKFAHEDYKFNIEKYKDKDTDVAFYTGFADYDAMQLCYTLIEKAATNIIYEHEKEHINSDSPRRIGRPRVLTKFQEFTLVMMRLRLGLFERDLAHRFNVSIMTVSRITRAWIRFLRYEFEPLINIPPREVIHAYMPEVFKNLFPNVAVIVDCTEVEMEKPSSLDSQSACYSSYKSRNTMKSLLGITPSGVLCFVSDFFPGSTSDKEITVLSGFLNKLKVGDQVMADKGFNCQDELASVGATLLIPAFLKGTKQFSKEQSQHNKTIASLRVHVERLMERIKNWHIFDHRIPISLAPVASDMLVVVCALSNFHPPLIN